MERTTNSGEDLERIRSALSHEAWSGTQLYQVQTKQLDHLLIKNVLDLCFPHYLLLFLPN